MRGVTLSSLAGMDAFALLGPGHAGGSSWVLATPGGDGELVFARYEDRGNAPRRWRVNVEPVAVTWDVPPVSARWTVDMDGHAEGVRAIRDAIAAGDVYQVNLTVRARVETADAAGLLARLCARGVPPFAAWVRMPGVPEFVSASPEKLFSVDGGMVRAEPMKGTAPPGGEAALFQSGKDAAELAMITDLVRNDLQQVCEPRSVKVPCARRFITLPYAVQAVADVAGTLRDGLGVADVLAVMHPAGSITGAPRGMACSMIEQVETTPRGAYCGSLGLVQGDNAAFSVLIRTAQATGDGAFVLGVGGGITWDSDADAEADEVRTKLGVLG